MIQFHPIRIGDRARIERYTMPSGIVNCDLSFANMFCWQGVYRSAWAEVDGFLVIRFHIGGGAEIGYMQPVGAGDFTPVVEALADDARALGQRLRLAGLTEEGCTQLRRAYPGVFAFGTDRAAEDYVYAASTRYQFSAAKRRTSASELSLSAKKISSAVKRFCV